VNSVVLAVARRIKDKSLAVAARDLAEIV